MSRQGAGKCIREGMTHHQAGRAAEAAACYSRARIEDPQSWEGHHYGGMASLLLGHPHEALSLFATALKFKPRSGPTAVALGLTQLALGLRSDAEASLRMAVHLEPRNVQAWDNLGLVLREQGRLGEAFSCLDKALSLNPGHVMAWVNKGIAYLDTPAVWDARDCFERALRLAPHNESALAGRAVAVYRSHLVGEAAGLFSSLFSRNPKLFHIGSYLLLALNNLDGLSTQQLWMAHQAFGRAVGGSVRHLAAVVPQGRPLRVAFLSRDLKQHSVAHFLMPLLRHAPEDICLLLYHDNAVEDAVSVRFKELASVWRNFAGQVDAVVERQILDDGPDVLVDLAGHTGMNRLPMLARRLAPVQINYLGYPNTTGVPAMDFRFVDLVSDPPELSDAWHSEKLLRLPVSAWCFEPPAASPECRSVPLAPEAALLFGCFNHATKITDQMLGLWAAILKGCPGSRLLLKSPGLEHPQIREPFMARLRKAGLDENRCEVLDTTPGIFEHLACYQRVDIALDTFPYNGTTTTCEALWMGVPVLSLCGDRHAARVGASLLTSAGLDALVVHSAEAYVSKALELAATLRQGGTCLRGSALRMRLQASPLMEQTKRAAEFWDAIRRCVALKSTGG